MKMVDLSIVMLARLPEGNFLKLVGGLEHFVLFHILEIIIPIDELIFFRGVGQPPTRLNLIF